jgi:hypothetical protein
MRCPATAIDHRDAFQFVDFMASLLNQVASNKYNLGAQ